MLLILLLTILQLEPRVQATVIGCGTGYFEDQNICDCEICPIGTYNDQEDAESCTSCPPGWTTVKLGSSIESQCRLSCSMGYYAASTGPLIFDRECMICPRGSYSDTDTARECIQCPSGQTTAGEGSTSRSNCQDDPCVDAVCRIHNFCRYTDRWDECFCTTPWTGSSCTNTQYITTDSSTITLATTDEFQAISSPNYPGFYPNNANITFTIHSPEGSHVKLTFWDLSIQGDCSFDTLIIYDGNNTLGTEIIKICYTFEQPTVPVYSTSNAMTLRFITDLFGTRRGFFVSISEQPDTDPCADAVCRIHNFCYYNDSWNECFCTSPWTGLSCTTTQYITADSATITFETTSDFKAISSPNYPRNYPTLLYMTITIRSPEGSFLKLIFLDLSIQPHCEPDRIFIYDGGSDDPVLSNICFNYERPTEPVYSSRNMMTVKFIAVFSDSSRGFFAIVSSHAGSVRNECESSPCENGATCVDGFLSFTCICVEGIIGDRCQYEDYCFGENNPCPSNGHCISPLGGDRAECVCNQGFTGNICQYATGCNITLNVTNTWQYLATEGYPGEYMNNQNCEFNFVAPSGRRIVIVFEDFELEYDYDFLHFPNDISYSTIPPTFISESDSVTLRFTSDDIEPEAGILMVYFLNVDECEALPCQNDGTCVEEHDGYTCQCTDQWLGENCTEINNCYPDPCVNGTCVDGDNTYTCSCLDGYKGLNCDEINPACTNISCQNGGSCLHLNETINAVCICEMDFVGEFCEDKKCGLAAIPPVIISKKRIVGGVEAVPNSWPWQVSMQRFGRHQCGGSIISKEFIVTAAHCNPSVMDTFLLGAHDVENCERLEGCVEVNIIQTWIHDQYNLTDETPPINDIAVVRFSPPISQFTDKISPVCLPQPGDEGRLPFETNCYATGWGEGSESDNLYQVHLQLVNQSICNYLLRPLFDEDSMICAGDPETGVRGVCEGDSGGSFVCQLPREEKWKLFGITSWHFAPCGNTGALTRVANYIDWIQNIIQQYD